MNKMHVSKELINVLSNASKVRTAINFGEGNEVRTKDSSGTFNAIYTVDETFPKPFCVYDLSNFISVLRLFEKPVIEFHDNNMVITDESGRGRISYAYTKEILIDIHCNYGTKISLDNKIATFTLSNKDYTALNTAASLFDVKDIRIAKNDDNSVLLEATTTVGLKASSDNKYSVSIDSTVVDTDKFNTLNIALQKGYLKLIPDDYTVSIYAFREQVYMLEFISSNDKIKYYVGAKVL